MWIVDSEGDVLKGKERMVMNMYMCSHLAREEVLVAARTRVYNGTESSYF